ncbi:MAG: DUF2272 domain-containing protein [Proteobacteria bacterium]|nr:DUF2272 domain-containing protein [Pseudomonadota bacterium]
MPDGAARRLVPALLLLAALAACAAPQQRAETAAGVPRGSEASDSHVPPFARVPYEPISREAVVAIALREWKMFDKPVNDDPPGSRPPLPADEKPERWEGYWQRVGEYWWLGLDAGDPRSGLTGKHNEYGQTFDAKRDGYYAWSAAFVSYVFRIAGAGAAFPYSSNHAEYINAAAEQALGAQTHWIITAERPEAYAPQLGDLICEGRGKSGRLRFDDLPARRFPAHCDIVVEKAPGQISVIGGNVDDAVTMKHVPVTDDGKLATPDGTVVDTRYPWMAVLRVNYPAAAPIS